MQNPLEAKKVHFVGIGGIGISAIARMMLAEGKRVSGSDAALSKAAQELKEKGAAISIGHHPANIPVDSDLMIFSKAVPEDNPELEEGKKRGIQMVSYPEFLGLISKQKYTIAVAGTHGKTTTTAMVAKVSIEAGHSPTVVVGSFITEFQSNFLAGAGEELIVEADEYRRAFLTLSPKILVITNIEADHLDYFKDLNDVISAFAELAVKLPEDGFLVCDPNSPNLKDVIVAAKGKVVDYTQYLDHELQLRVIGAHNKKNAAAALAAADALHIDLAVAKHALELFTGTWRRFEYKGAAQSGADVYDDYGHHPTEVKATLRAAREQFPDRKIILVFQPHQYNRLKTLFEDFAVSFFDADEVLILPVVRIREKEDPSINSQMLVDAANKHKHNARCIPTYEEAEHYLRTHAEKGDLVLTMGATDVYKIGEALVQK